MSEQGRVDFTRRVEPGGERVEDADTARLVTSFQGGDRGAFAALYRRYFERVYGYMRVAVRDAHEAEDLTQQVFTKVFEALPAYRAGRQPFRAWLFTVVRNHAINHMRKQSRVETTEPAEIDRRRDNPADDQAVVHALSWIDDGDLLFLVERLPLAQRQVLVLRFLLGLGTREIAETLGRTEVDIRGLQHRGLTFLRKRLKSLGRVGERGELIRMRGRFKQAPVLRHRRFSLKP